MINSTTNLKLKKPDDIESFDVEHMNFNSDMIDKAVGNLASAINEFANNSKIVVTEDPIERQEGCFYFFITDKQSQNIVDNLKVSPSMGLKIEE